MSLPSPLVQFVLAIGLGYAAFWVMLWFKHHGELMQSKREVLEHAGMRREAQLLAVVLSLTWCAMGAVAPSLATNLDPAMQLRLAGGASGVWLACGTVLMLSVQWWRQRTLWKVK